MGVAVLLFAAAVASGPPAYASCATEAMVSPYAFVGTVISTERKDHIGTVITDSGQRVTVLGTEGGFPESFRSAVPGQHLYRDSATCGSAASAVAASERFPARLASHRRASRICGISLFFGPVSAGVVLLILAGRKVFQRFTARAG